MSVLGTEEERLIQWPTVRAFQETAEKVRGDRPLRYASPSNANEAWKKYSEVADKYDDGMCKSFHQQIDTVLVSAGLFSAVVTAFTIESYQWLYSDSGDATVQLLLDIARSLNNTARPAPSVSAVPDSEAVLINVYWFLALLLSLSSAFIAIVSKQWISEYERRYRQSSRDGLAVRQAKLAGLESWKVEGIATSLPLLLLQAALALFFFGILQLLWMLHKCVAVPAIITSCALLTFYLITTVLPSVQFACWHYGRHLSTKLPAWNLSPYKSPQAWLVLRALFAATNVFSHPGTDSPLPSDKGRPGLERVLSATSWIEYDYEFVYLCQSDISHSQVDGDGEIRMPYEYVALEWLMRRFDHSDLTKWTWRCLWPFEGTRDGRKPILRLAQMSPILKYLELPSHYAERHPILQCMMFFMDSCGTDAAPGQAFELLLLAQDVALSLEARFAQDAAATSGRVRLKNLPPRSMAKFILAVIGRCSAKNVDDYACKALFATLARNTLWAHSPELFRALKPALRVMGMSESKISDERKDLVLATCPLIHRWLVEWAQAYEISYFITDVLDMLADVCRLLGIDQQSEMTPRNPRTRVLAALALAIDRTWQERGRSTPLTEHIRLTSSTACFSEVFLKLVETAKEEKRVALLEPDAASMSIAVEGPEDEAPDIRAGSHSSHSHGETE